MLGLVEAFQKKQTNKQTNKQKQVEEGPHRFVIMGDS